MSCEKCKETDCVLSSNMFLENGTEVFADIRFDLDANQLDINVGSIGEDGFPEESYWSDGLDIKFCPFCGEKLKEL